MSFYNLIHGTSLATFFILPMLGKHPDEYPRFRDCFVNDQDHPEYDDHIHVYTRTGGGNRESYADQNEEMRSMPGFVTDYDDGFDSTYASWVFTIPVQWLDDYRKITSGSLKDVSMAYQSELRRVFPKLSDKFDEIFEAPPDSPSPACGDG